MESEFSPTEKMFNMTWRTLSYAAVPAMLPATSLDTNGLIPRSFCPQVYDTVKKHVTDMREEAQFAAWYWVVPAPSSQGEAEAEMIGWHPCFTLPANRRIVTRNVNADNTDLAAYANPRRSISSSSIHNSSYSSGHRRRSSGDVTRRMSLVREEGRSEDNTADAASERIRRSSSLHVRPGIERT